MLDISYGTGEDSRNRILQQVTEWKKANPAFKVIDVGGNAVGWSASIADVVVDINSPDSDNNINMDICKSSGWDKLLELVEREGMFDYAICTHTLEDIYNPFSALDYFPKIARAGIITMPSMTADLSNGESPNWLGYIHHRWVFDQVDGEMIVAPKLTFLEYLVSGNIVRDLANEEIRYDWTDSIPYRHFMNNYLGPDMWTVVNEYQQFITDRLQ